MCISGIYALNEEMNDIQNGLSTSSVDIEIKEYNQNNELFQEDGKEVMPGDEIILIPKVNNLGIECYIRTKITYTINNTAFSSLDYIEGNYSNWTKKGEYYYYDSIFGKEETVDLFNKVLVPDNLSSEYNGKKITITIVVDAIQAKNFTGNWDNTPIKKSINRTYDIDYSGDSTVIYENDTNNHVTLDGGFFDNLGNMLPGDCISEEVKILNNSNQKNKYYLIVDYNGLTSAEIALLKKIRMVIKDSNDNIIVNSNLANKDKHNLGIFEPGNGNSYLIELTFPIDADNDYSKLFTKITWKFSYDNIKSSDSSTNPNNPKTGDLKFDLAMLVFILSSIGFIIVLFLEKINNGRKKEKI